MMEKNTAEKLIDNQDMPRMVRQMDTNDIRPDYGDRKKVLCCSLVKNNV